MEVWWRVGWFEGVGGEYKKGWRGMGWGGWGIWLIRDE